MRLKRPFPRALAITILLLLGSVASSFSAPEKSNLDIVSVADFNAPSEGQADASAAIQKALDSGAKTVVIPKGIYSISQTLQLGSDITLKADPEAVIRLADNAGTHARVFVLTNKNPGNGNANITVEGGIWDGNNEHNQRSEDGDLSGYTGTAINFVNVRHLTLKNLTVRNPDAFSVRIGEVEDFLVENITLDHTMIRPNQDGIHVGGYSQRGVIRNIRALHPNTPNDDMIALNADDDVERVINLGMRRGPIRDILVEDIYAEGAYTFVRLLSKDARLENIQVRRVNGACRHYAVNLNRWRFPVGAGDIRNIQLEEFNVAKSAEDNPKHSLIHITLMARDVHFTGFARNASDKSPATTLLLDNGCENTLQEGTGPTRNVTSFSIPQGGIQDLWLNRTAEKP